MNAHLEFARLWFELSMEQWDGKLRQKMQRAGWSCLFAWAEAE